MDESLKAFAAQWNFCSLHPAVAAAAVGSVYNKVKADRYWNTSGWKKIVHSKKKIIELHFIELVGFFLGSDFFIAGMIRCHLHGLTPGLHGTREELFGLWTSSRNYLKSSTYRINWSREQKITEQVNFSKKTIFLIFDFLQKDDFLMFFVSLLDVPNFGLKYKITLILTC